MGSCDFETLGYGKTPGEAFHQAWDQATYDRGHEGYTGTIAEKPGARFFDLAGAGLTYARFVKLERAYEDWYYSQGGQEQEDAGSEGLRPQEEGWKSSATKPRGVGDYTVTQAFKEGRCVKSEYRWYSRKLVAPPRRVPKCPVDARYLPLVRKAFHQANDDKWEDAACVELDGPELSKAKERLGIKGKRGLRVFRFWGYASC